jgi:hypothetical protein
MTAPNIYDRFRRAEAAWITVDNGETFLNIGTWADSYDSNLIGPAVEFVGWDTTEELDREGNPGGFRSGTVVTPAEFAAFIARPAFVSYVAEYDAAMAERMENR